MDYIMGKCLITTLQEVVKDDSLLKLGELRLYALGAKTDITAQFDGTISVLNEDGYFTDTSGNNLGKTVVIGSGVTKTIRLSNTGNNIVSVSNKYGIVNLSIYGVECDIDQLIHSTKMVQIILNGKKGTKGSLLSFANSAKSLYYLDLFGTSVEGTVEDFAQACVDAGRISGSFTLNVANTNVTYQGSVPYGALKIAFSASGYTVTTA